MIITLYSSPGYYDQETQLTAQELRSVGLPIPATIPDPAVISRAALRYGLEPGGITLEEDGQIDVQIRLDFLESFRWSEQTIELEVPEHKDPRQILEEILQELQETNT